MNTKPAKVPENLLDELQATLAHGTVASRVEALRRVTDLFLNNAVDYSDEQIGLFDDVFQCLMLHIETSAKALLANRLAPVDTAPPMTIRALAFDDISAAAGVRQYRTGQARAGRGEGSHPPRARGQISRHRADRYCARAGEVAV